MASSVILPNGTFSVMGGRVSERAVDDGLNQIQHVSLDTTEVLISRRSHFEFGSGLGGKTEGQCSVLTNESHVFVGGGENVEKMVEWYLALGGFGLVAFSV